MRLSGIFYMFLIKDVWNNSMVVWLTLIGLAFGIGAAIIIGSAVKGKNLDHSHPEEEEAPEPEPENTWTCPKCKEKVEDNFNLCWNCSSPREEKTLEESQ